MKRFTFFSIAFVLAFSLLAGCGGDDDDDDGEVVGPEDGLDGEGMGDLSSMSAGSWAEYTVSEGGRETMKFLGEDTWDGSACYVLETESVMDGDSTVSQIWIDKATGEVVLFLIKMGDVVMKMDITASQDTDVPGEDDPWEEPSAKESGTGTYTTPTGKTVNVTKYTLGTDEYWVSSEVPFGEVKDISNGEVYMELNDFGLSGATRSISREEAENAEPFGINIPDIPEIPGN
jgi:hypothetical protein